MQNPEISVIIPLYNHEKYIKEAVCSVLEQTFSDFELIIINDGSKDRSEEVVKGIQDRRIKYYYQENCGAHNAINRGIDLAKGEYISILNSDDVYCPDRLERFVEIFKKDNSIGAVFSHIEFIDDQGNFIKYKMGAEDNWTNHDPNTSFKGEDNIFLDLLAGNFLVTTSNLFCRKNVFKEIGLFRNLRYTHDYDFFLKVCYFFKTYVVKTPLLKYRFHSGNTIKQDEAATDFEVGLVLSNFILTHDLSKYFSGKNIYSTMVKFFNSINTKNSEMIMMVFIVFALQYKKNDEFFREIIKNPENSFRKVGIDYLKNYIDQWQESRKAWSRWSEANKRLLKSDKKISEAADETKKWWQESQKAWSRWSEANEKLIKTNKKLNETEERLIEKERKIDFLLNSIPYRTGRIITWPVRKIFSKKDI